MAQSTMTRGPGSRSSAPQPSSRRTRALPGASIYTLARWQLRQTWRLLTAIGAGMLLAVVLVCALPLYAQVSMSASLRHTLNEDPQNAFLTVHANGYLFANSEIQTVQQELNQLVQNALGPVAPREPVRSVQIGQLDFSGNDSLRLVGADMTAAKGQVKVLAGHLPALTSRNTIEFAAPQDAAHDLGLKLGKTLQLTYPAPSLLHPRAFITLTVQLVGIINHTSATQQFWHGETFESSSTFVGLRHVVSYPVLVSNTELANVLENASDQFQKTSNGQHFAPNSAPEIYWYYDFDFAHLDINRLPDLTNSFKALLTIISNNPTDPPYILNTTSTGPLNVLQEFANRVTVFQIPTLCLTFLISALALFFVLLMTDVLVERHREAITLLRSRGASGGQVLCSLLSQGVFLGIIAFVAGPLLAILLVIALAMFTLAKLDVGATNVISTDLLQTSTGLLWHDLLVVGLALLAVGLTIWRVMRSNILTARRESARSTIQPFWLRYRLDLLAALVALVGFGLSIYIASPGVLDVRTRALVLPLTSLVGVLFLLIGCLLLFLRVFPAFLRWGERMAARNRGAAPLLALAQTARSPRQVLRMILLLALAIAFTLFTVIFSATQEQRLQDLTAYQVGSDFSGQIPSVLQENDWNSLETYYHGIKGVTAVTLGDSTLMNGGVGQSATLQLEAVDSSTYAQTFYWSAQNSDQPIGALMNQLHDLHTDADKRNVIPAILDDAAAQSLNVRVGQQFVLADFHGPMNYQVLAIVHYLPTIYDTASSTGGDTSIPQGGLLVDFQTYSDVALAVNLNGISATLAWLRSGNSATDVQSAHQGLLTGTYALTNGLDRRAQTQGLATDPMYKALVGLLTIGAVVALLLALFGNLLISWLNARGRRVSFSVLRALGCQPGQIAGVLIWEQGMIYVAGLLLGVVLSTLFTLFILPAFIFSPLVNSDSAEAFYVVQSVPAIRTVLPVLPLVGVLLGLIVICGIAIWMILRVLTRSRLGQLLRINED